MDRKIIVAKLVELANTLDSKGFLKEADEVDKLMQQANKNEGISGLTAGDSANILSSFCQWLRNRVDFFEGLTRQKTIVEALRGDKILDDLLLYYLEVLGFDTER